VTRHTLALASLVGVQNKIKVITHKSQEVVSLVDIITNSGHIRPIDAEMISWMKPTAVISLMYETWEFRQDDINLAACQQYYIPVAGVNERHPTVDVFSFLGLMAIKLLTNAGIAVYASRILLLCDNPFSTFIEQGLIKAGASVDTYKNLSEVTPNKSYDVILVALQPHSETVVSSTDAAIVASCWPGAVIAQFWGNVDRSAFSEANIPVWPLEAPAFGHMGILPSEIGPEPIIRLQVGGLKVGEVLWKARQCGDDVNSALLQLEKSNFGERIPTLAID
jgi:hypothetical protein